MTPSDADSTAVALVKSAGTAGASLAGPPPPDEPAIPTKAKNRNIRVSWPIRKIEGHLRMSWRTIKKYLEAPAQTAAMRSRISKLDPFKPTVAELLEKDARASAAVIEQRLRPLGYDDGHTILRDYIHKVRPQPQPQRAFVRMEPEAGERFEVDWGHFGALQTASLLQTSNQAA